MIGLIIVSTPVRRLALKYFTRDRACVYKDSEQRLVSFRFYVCCPRFNFSLSYYVINFFYRMFFLIIENTELPCLAEICYMVGYSLGSVPAISFNENILESILSSNLCECFYLPEDLGRIH